MGIEFNPENVNLNYDGKSSGKKVTPQNQNKVGSTEIGDLLRKNSKETSSSDLVDKMIRDFNKLPKIEQYILRPDGTKEPYLPGKYLDWTPPIITEPDGQKYILRPDGTKEPYIPAAPGYEQTPPIITEPDGQRYIILPDGTKVPYAEAKELVEMPQIITEIDGQRYVVDENGVLVEYDNEEPSSENVVERDYDFVPIDSPLGQGLSRPTGEFNPNIDGKYEPVYESPVGSQRKIIGYRRIYPGAEHNMLDWDKLPQSIKHELEILKDIKNF